MLEQLTQTLIQQFNFYGIPCLGSFIVAISFGIFYGRNTQYARFFALSLGFWILSLVALIQLIAPCFPVLNPAFYVPETVLDIAVAIVFTFAGGFFLSSLFPSLPRFSRLVIAPCFFSILLMGAGYGLYWLNLSVLEPQRIPTLLIGTSLIVAAFAFHSVPILNQRAIFSATRYGILALGTYFILQAFHLISDAQNILLVLYVLVAVIVLLAQLRFMQTTVLSTQAALEAEKKKKTLFWDIAPFPILLTKLLDDSIVYMNDACQKVLGLTDEQKNSVHFSAYFVDEKKRQELIERTKTQGIVDRFEVELNSQNSDKTLWITLSSRVFEVEGELVLYINFTNITEQKETEQELFIQASTDTLTGLYNRRQFFALTDQAFAMAQREHTPYCAIMLDIDHFKNINDTYGHDAGDLVLKHLSDVMRQTLRKSDIIARWGGEEFIIFLQNTTPEKGIHPANKLREAVQATSVTVGDKVIQFTISLGVSASQTPDVAALQKEADLALYHSKENGRNQVTLYDESVAQMHPEGGEA